MSLSKRERERKHHFDDIVRDVKQNLHTNKLASLTYKTGFAFFLLSVLLLLIYLRTDVDLLDLNSLFSI